MRNLGRVLAAALLTVSSVSPVRGADTGTGIPTSQLAVTVSRGELLVYPSFGYHRDQSFEYDPAEFGFPSSGELLGQYRANEEAVFLAYGLSDRLAWEMTAAGLQASLRRAAEDRSGMPVELKQSGLGDVRSRVTWRLLDESGHRPEIFTYGEVFFPHDRDKRLVGTPDWVFDAGLGVTRRFRWGTVTLRSDAIYELASVSRLDWGEASIEYLEHLSPRVTVFGAVVMVEGDEATLVTELQWSLGPNVLLRLNNGVGLTSHTADWTPGIGVLFRFPIE